MFAATALNETFPFTEAPNSSYKIKHNFPCSSLVSTERIQLAHKASESAAQEHTLPLTCCINESW